MFKKISIVILVAAIFIGVVSLLFKPNVSFNFQFHIGNISGVPTPSSDDVFSHVATMLGNTDNNSPLGGAKKVGQYAWEVNYPQDTKMATPGELFDALNRYRQQHNQKPLLWSRDLADYAQKRAELFAHLQKVDDHKGFMSDANDGYFKKFGFTLVGENSESGFVFNAKHMIENFFGAEPDHDNGQLSPLVTHVGIAVVGSSVDFIFGFIPH